MPVRSLPAFPLDIIEIILENLAHENDMVSLKACSLVCHAFVFICRKHIFSRIELDSALQYSGGLQVHSFKRLLDRNACIANYVRNLDYTNALGGSPVPSILHHFRRVTTFSLNFRDFRYPPGEMYEWNKMPRSLKSALPAFIQSNQISELSLFGIQDIPVLVFMYFPQLKKLSLNCITIANISLHGHFFKPRKPAKLVSLLVRNSDVRAMIKLLDSGASGVKPIINLTGLEEFSLIIDEDPSAMDAIRSVLKVTESLRYLLFTGSHPDINLLGTFACHLTPTSLQTLKTVKLHPMLETQEESPYFNCIPELQQIAGKNVIEELLFRISVETDRRCTTDPSIWVQLDHVLSQPGGFPFLRRVGVRVTIWRCSRDSIEFQSRLEDIGRRCFPWLSENKVIQFGFEVAIEDV